MITVDTLVPEQLWQSIQPLLPSPPRRYGGRPRVDDRACLVGIVYQLRTGIPGDCCPLASLAAAARSPAGGACATGSAPASGSGCTTCCWMRLAASGPSVLNCRVEVLELDAGILGGEPPVHAAASRVAGRLPRGDLPREGHLVGQPPVQALPGQHTQLDLGHVQPAAVLGCVVQLQPVGQPLGLRRRERRVQRRRRVGVEVVLDQHDHVGVGIVHIDQLPDAVRPVDPGPPLAHRHMPPATQRLAHQEHVAHPLPHVLVILACWPAGRGWQRRSHLGQQLPAGLVQTHLRAAWVIGPGVDLQHVLHPPAEFGVLLGWDAPALGQPRLEPVCFKTCRTVSRERSSTTSSSTSRPASSRNVHRLRPSGGALHANATKRASCSPSSLRRYSRAGGLRCTAASSPAVTYCWRTRATVAGWTSNASAITRSVQPGPASPWLALSRMRAWVSARAGAAPWPISVWSCARSGSDNITMCRLRTWVSSGGGIPGPHEPSPQATHHANHHCQATSPSRVHTAAPSETKIARVPTGSAAPRRAELGRATRFSSLVAAPSQGYHRGKQMV